MFVTCFFVAVLFAFVWVFVVVFCGEGFVNDKFSEGIDLYNLCCSRSFTNRLANVRRIERHDKATTSKACVAVTLHDHRVGDSAM